jgi:hypothetical protein
MNFNEFYWHDAIIKNIIIDRTSPGQKDTISFEMIWPNNKAGIIIFENVYKVKMSLNFGIIANECVSMAFISPDDEDLILLRSLWKDYYDVQKLVCYVIRTSSTGSEIKIISTGFSVNRK